MQWQTGTGLWIATSGTDRRTACVVSLHECECPGHASDGYCKHRAILAWTLGVLTIGAPEPEPPTPAARAGRLAGLTNAEIIALKADAMKQHVFHGAPLVNIETGEVLADAAYHAAIPALGFGSGPVPLPIARPMPVR